MVSEVGYQSPIGYLVIYLSVFAQVYTDGGVVST